MELAQTDDDLLTWYRRALIRLSISADGISDYLNAELNAFRAMLRQRVSVIDELESQLVKIEEQTDSFQQLYQQLFENNKRSFKALIRILSKFDDSQQTESDLTTLISVVEQSDGLILDSIGWLSAISSISERVHLLPDDENHDLIPLFKQDVARLLGYLEGATDDPTPLRELEAQLEVANSSVELRIVLRAISNLILTILNRHQNEFEQYLERINTRLAQIRQALNDNGQMQKEFQIEDRLFADEMRHHVASLNQKIDAMPPAGKIKEEISDQLLSIAEGLERFHHNSHDREKQLDLQLKELRHKVSELEKENRKFHAELALSRKQAYCDNLTGLANRAEWERRSDQEVLQYQRYKRGLVLAICDLDLFKRINDQFGHQAGDRVLQIVAKKLKDGIRKTDFVARYGGEEFVILLPETSLSDAARVCEQLRAAIGETKLHFKGQPVGVSISIGLAEFTPNTTLEDVFVIPHTQLYTAKENGRNKVCYPQPIE